MINQTDRMITSEVLSADAGIHHAFFTRRGGVSEGLFGSLNCGFGSGDASPKVAHNRGIAMACLGLAGDRLATLRQVHSAEVVIVEQPWCREEAPMADGLVSGVPGIALGVLAADCAPILLHDPVARVIGAAHGGWRGALGGIVDGTIARMAELGAERPGSAPRSALVSVGGHTRSGRSFRNTLSQTIPATCAFLHRRQPPADFCLISRVISRIGSGAPESRPST